MTRILPSAEWHRLDAQSEAFCASVNPSDVAPVVVEDEGEIVARMLVVRVPHLEGFWIAPEKAGNAGVTRALLRAATVKAREWAPYWIHVNAESEAMCDTLIRLGGELLPVQTFNLPLYGSEMEESACPLP